MYQNGYPKEKIQETLDLIDSGISVSRTAAKVGVARSTVQNWIHRYCDESFPKNSRYESQELIKENEGLRLINEKLRYEIDYLHEQIAYWANLHTEGAY